MTKTRLIPIILNKGGLEDGATKAKRILMKKNLFLIFPSYPFRFSTNVPNSPNVLPVLIN